MHSNYEYVLEYCERLPQSSSRILDYGCGKGDIVEEGVRRGLDMYGVEAFADGSGVGIIDVLVEKGMYGKRVKGLEGAKIPFPDSYFDFIVSNQVFEHVRDIDSVLSEMQRVLKPGGKVLSLFASQESIREGHCRILFAHWLPPNSKILYYWLLFWRSLGFGRLKRGRTNRRWAEFFNEWLGTNVTYRSTKNIDLLFSKFIGDTFHIEDGYISFRLKEKNWGRLACLSTSFFIRPITKCFCRKWAGLVFYSEKPIDNK